MTGTKNEWKTIELVADLKIAATRLDDYRKINKSIGTTGEYRIEKESRTKAGLPGVLIQYREKS